MAEEKMGKLIRMMFDGTKRRQPDPTAVDLFNQATATENHDEAESLYKQAIELDPSCAAAYNNLGYLLSLKGERTQAEELFRTAIRYDDNNVEANYNLGLSMVERGQKEGLLYLYGAVHLRPDFTQAYAAIAMGYEALALANWNQCLRANPNYELAMHAAKCVKRLTSYLG